MAEMDRKLIAKTQQYEVKYFAKKFRMSLADARAVLQDAGRSREKAIEIAMNQRIKGKPAERPTGGT